MSERYGEMEKSPVNIEENEWTAVKWAIIYNQKSSTDLEALQPI